MKYYIIAGEASGDLHGANLMKQLKEKDPQAEFRIWGGDRMKKEGGDLVRHYRDLAFMGFTEVLMNLRTILKNIKFCKEDIKIYQPDAVILIDYPGFNLRIAKHASKAGFKVFYYISPQVWAWKSSRVKKIKKFVDRMFVILPFEKDFYHAYDHEVEFVGHPLIDAIENQEDERLSYREFINKNQLPDQPIIAIVPGSRRQEIERILPIMISIRSDFPEYQFLVSNAPSIPDEFYQNLLQGTDVHLIHDQTYSLLENARAALVTSGTATLETALFGTPEVVCYSGSRISYHIARKLVNVEYISLVNLIMDREVVKELIQSELTPQTIRQELYCILKEGPTRKKMLQDLQELKEKLGGKGASEKTAKRILELAK